jgi:chromosome segregation ATPase
MNITTKENTMIEWVEIKNFQCHKELKVDFKKGINAIVGSSDKGKSAIIRAIIWCLTNKPKGIDFITKGAKVCTVSVRINGHTIKRVRGKSKNEYYLDDQKFTAFGGNVPEDIMKATGIDEELFYQDQFDPVFLLDKPSGQVASYINELIDMAIIDEAITKSKKNIRKHNDEIKTYNEQLSNTRKTVDMLKGVEEVSELYKTIPFDDEVSLGRELEVVDGLVKVLEINEHSEKQLEVVMNCVNFIERVEAVAKRLEKIEDELATYTRLLNDVEDNSVEDVSKEITTASETIDSIEEIMRNLKEGEEVRKSFTVICDTVREKQGVEGELNILKIAEEISEQLTLDNTEEATINGLSELCSNLRGIKSVIDNSKEAIEELEAEYNEIKPDVCPICDNKL